MVKRHTYLRLEACLCTKTVTSQTTPSQAITDCYTGTVAVQSIQIQALPDAFLHTDTYARALMVTCVLCNFLTGITKQDKAPQQQTSWPTQPTRASIQ